MSELILCDRILCDRCSGKGYLFHEELIHPHNGKYDVSFSYCDKCEGKGRLLREVRVTTEDSPLPAEPSELSADSRKKEERLKDALRPLATIAQAYLENNLDDEARRFWGSRCQFENENDPKSIVLYSGRGGRTLLTLEDCMKAYVLLRMKWKG